MNWLKNNNRPAGRGTGVNGAATTATTKAPLKGSVELDGTLVVQRKHTDWIEHQVRWKWLLDSYEGGDRYRNAVYGPDRRGLPCRNLFRHKREYPDPQTNPGYGSDAGFAMAGGPGLDPSLSSIQTAYGPFPGQLGADAAATAT